RGETRKTLTGLDLTSEDTTNGSHSAIIIVTKHGDKQLQRRLRVHFGWGNMSQNDIEQRLEIRPSFRRKTSFSSGGLGIDNGKIRLFLTGSEFDEEVKCFVENTRRFSVLAINLV